MKSLILSQFPMIYLTCAGLLIFFGFFIGVLAWVFRKGGREVYDRIAPMPLRED